MNKSKKNSRHSYDPKDFFIFTGFIRVKLFYYLNYLKLIK